MKCAAATVLLSALAIAACASGVRNSAVTASNHNHVLKVSTCTLAGHGAPPSGTEVRVATFYITDYIERSRLVSSACPSVHVALSLESATIGTHDKNARKQIVRTLQLDYIEGRRTGVYAIDVTGRFVYRKDEQPHAVIYADHVWSFKRLPCTAFYSAVQCKGMD